jgi:hypothetical protein
VTGDEVIAIPSIKKVARAQKEPKTMTLVSLLLLVWMMLDVMLLTMTMKASRLRQTRKRNILAVVKDGVCVLAESYTTSSGKISLAKVNPRFMSPKGEKNGQKFGI